MPLTPGQIADWEVLVGIKPDPTAEFQAPNFGPDPWADFQIPAGTDIGLQEGLGIVKLVESLRQQRNESQAAAVRYAGQTDYQRMIEQGVDPDEALRRAAPKMFYEHPAGLTAAMKAMQPPRSVMDLPTIENIQGRDFWQNPRTGDWHALTDPSVRQTATRAFKSTLEYDTLTRQIQAAQREYDRLQKDMDAMGYASTGVAPPGLARRARIQQEEINRLYAARTAAEKVYGTGAPPVSSTVTESASPAPKEVPATEMPQLPAGTPVVFHNERVKVQSPAGKVGTIPADQVDKALAAGYRLFQASTTPQATAEPVTEPTDEIEGESNADDTGY